MNTSPTGIAIGAGTDVAIESAASCWPRMIRGELSLWQRCQRRAIARCN
jgi:hypothetical protein